MKVTEIVEKEALMKLWSSSSDENKLVGKKEGTT